MTTVVLCASAVAAADAWVKDRVRRQPSLRLVSSPVWHARLGPAISPLRLWVIWTSSAAALVLVTTVMPALQVPAGLLIGGALGNLIEQARRGSVSDYLHIGGWPAFNLADVAILVGTAGVAWVLAARLVGSGS